MKSYLPRTTVQHPILQSLVGIAASVLLISGCASGAKLAQNPNNSVYLEEVSDWSFEASHPAVIDQQTITKIVKGLYANDSITGSSRMSAGGSKPMRIFSDEDVEFLSPLLTQGLAKAKPEQLVGFHISSSAGSGSEPTTGSLYVLKESIYLTLRKGTEPIGFMPESAARTEPAPAYASNGEPGAMTMIIDYHAMAKAPMPALLPMAKATSVLPTAQPRAQAVSDSTVQEAGDAELTAQRLSEIKTVRDALTKKETEISMLRKEAEWMKRQLRDRDEEMQALRLTKVSGKPAAKKKPAQAARTR
ncbi:MAG: hypothetical protein CAF43_008260 [Nitrospira sp. CG24C]|jgi:hypothetical protein|nr:MAG: hypothetical protein CAF43_008260 [Nitrospira sp. CG24C]